MTKEIQPASPNLPQLKKWPSWGQAYLDALDETGGHKTRAAQVIEVNYRTVYQSIQDCPQFAKEVDKIKSLYDDMTLDNLENLSVQQASKPGCSVERFFQLKALNPAKYREKTIQGPGNINIVLGYQVPPTPGRNIPLNGKITDAEVGGRGRPSISEILTEDDLDI